MAVSTFVSFGTVVATGTTAPAGYPTSFAAGDLLLLHVSSDSASINLSVAGWTSLGPVQTGGGMSVATWSKIASGSETGTVSVSITGGTKGVAYTAAYRTGGSLGIGAVLYRSGSDTDTSSTAYSASGASMTTSVDDRVVAMSVLLAPSGGTYTGGLTGTSTTQAGATLATHTPRTSGSAATSTIRYVLTDAAVTTGGTGAPTYAGTATGANAAGSTAFVVIREVANVAPTATITANQNVAASASVSATMTASDSDGTIASYSWTGTRYSTTAEPTAITLTGATTATASYTASASTGVLDVLTCVATDNGGLTVTKTTEVRVPTTGDITTLRGPGTGGTWTNTGGAASEGAAIADASNTTYLESPVLTTTETTKRLRLAPAASRVALTLTTTVSQDVAGTISAKVRLFEGSTLRQESALTTTTSAADQVFSITSGAIAAVTDWGNLYLEWAGTA